MRYTTYLLLFIGIVDSMCNTLHIPHIMTHWTYEPIGLHRSRRLSPRNLTINVYPDSDVLARALSDLINDYDWKSYVIVYDTDDSKFDFFFVFLFLGFCIL